MLVTDWEIVVTLSRQLSWSYFLAILPSINQTPNYNRICTTLFTKLYK